LTKAFVELRLRLLLRLSVLPMARPPTTARAKGSTKGVRTMASMMARLFVGSAVMTTTMPEVAAAGKSPRG